LNIKGPVSQPIADTPFGADRWQKSDKVSKVAENRSETGDPQRWWRSKETSSKGGKLKGTIKTWKKPEPKLDSRWNMEIWHVQSGSQWSWRYASLIQSSAAYKPDPDSFT